MESERKWIFGDKLTKNTNWVKYYSHDILNRSDPTEYAVVNPESFKKTTVISVDPIIDNVEDRCMGIMYIVVFSIFICLAIVTIAVAIVLYLCLTGKCHRRQN